MWLWFWVWRCRWLWSWVWVWRAIRLLMLRLCGRQWGGQRHRCAVATGPAMTGSGSSSARVACSSLAGSGAVEFRGEALLGDAIVGDREEALDDRPHAFPGRQVSSHHARKAVMVERQPAVADPHVEQQLVVGSPF